MEDCLPNHIGNLSRSWSSSETLLASSTFAESLGGNLAQIASTQSVQELVLSLIELRRRHYRIRSNWRYSHDLKGKSSTYDVEREISQWDGLSEVCSKAHDFVKDLIGSMSFQRFNSMVRACQLESASMIVVLSREQRIDCCKA
jgi:hypothetical protein